MTKKPKKSEDPEAYLKWLAETQRKGGVKGAKRRAKATTPESRAQMASHAAKARWKSKEVEPIGELK